MLYSHWNEERLSFWRLKTERGIVHLLAGEEDCEREHRQEARSKTWINVIICNFRQQRRYEKGAEQK